MTSTTKGTEYKNNNVMTVETAEETAAYWAKCRELDSVERESNAESDYRSNSDYSENA